MSLARTFQSFSRLTLVCCTSRRWFAEQFTLGQAFSVVGSSGALRTRTLFTSTGFKNLPNMASAEKKVLNHHILPLEQPIVSLDCDVAFNNLTPQEKAYAHYLSQASWYGGLIVHVQTSPESPLIFMILHDLFRTNGIKGLKDIAIGKCGFTEDEWTAFMVYTNGVFCNSGNYKSFGDTKIIPGVPSNKFELVVENATASALGPKKMEFWNLAKDLVYSLSEREQQLGLGEKGITTYFSNNCTMEDSDIVNKFMTKMKMDAYMTRVFKTIENGVTHYEIRTAGSVVQDGKSDIHDFEGAKFVFTTGDYSPLMAKVSEYLLMSKEYASNDTEKSMLQCYADSFTSASLDEHKNGSRFWIKDQGPAVETYIGFIETYRDPAGQRGEFEGFVSIVNRAMSAKFATLVDNAAEFIPLLPWPKEFERETFIKPDFTSLDVLTFSGSGIPAGINIPNYDEIRQNEGFKNVSLGNVIPAGFKDMVIPFLSEQDKELLNKYRIPAFEVQVALHELLGHGSGKLFTTDSKGVTNFSADIKNPLTQALIESTYNDGDSYDSIFTTIGSAYEECRAESVGIYLSLDKDVLKIFGHEGEEAENIIYVNWLSMVFAGAAKALEMYQPTTKSWMQAHSQARYVILQVLMEAGEGFVTIEEKLGTDDKPDLLITVDRTKIKTVGRKAMHDFLLKLQVYKSTANFAAAKSMFDVYSAVNNEGKHPWAKWREIIMDKKQPRKMFLQSNTFLQDGKVVLKNYDATHEGCIQSWIERFPDTDFYAAVESSWAKDRKHFNM